MERITKPRLREIIDDFAKDIEDRKTEAPKPKTTAIDFRNERKAGKDRPIWLVPIELLRYRRHNGRISSDVAQYEKDFGLLDEKSERDQKTIEGFLLEKDREKTKDLLRSLQYDGQREPAIITYDGFLINGNRRKVVLKRLSEKYPNKDSYKWMRVVILPGKGDPGGPPTVLEIEEIENRYQLQRDVKADYYGLDRALSIRRKMDLGMTLKQQLLDDPVHAGLGEKELKKAIKKAESDYLKPLACADEYLQLLGRDGLYASVSRSAGDPEGRWQAFIDYSGFLDKLSDEKWRIKHKIDENEIGRIKKAAFIIIRRRELKDLSSKVHQIMRELKKWVTRDDSKEELLKLSEIPLELPRAECVDKEDKELPARQVDTRWGQKYQTEIIKHVKQARDSFERKAELDTPIRLLEQALAKLEHKNMRPVNVNFRDYKRGVELTRKIQKRAKYIEAALSRVHRKSRRLPTNKH